jgi:hypothetical protein
MATRRRAQGATLQELADSYDRSICTMRRATGRRLSVGQVQMLLDGIDIRAQSG